MKHANNKIIVFANQKGGVGKTTLCTMFANYLSKMGKNVLVIDADVQQTISMKRAIDIKNGNEQTYEVRVLKLEDEKEVQEVIKDSLELDGFVLIDAPGNLTQNGLLHIFVNADAIVCPYQYEMTAINSTVTFIKLLQVLKSKVKGMKAQTIFVPNRIDRRTGKADELELWKQTDEGLKSFGKVAPRIASRQDVQRYTSVDLPKEQEKIVKDCFDFIYSTLFN